MEEYTIGNKLMCLRKMMNLTQTELASKLGYKNRQKIADIENNDKKPSFEFVMHFRQLFVNTLKRPFSLNMLFDTSKSHMAVIERNSKHKQMIEYYDYLKMNTNKKIATKVNTLNGDAVLDLIFESKYFVDFINSIVDTINLINYKNYQEQSVKNACGSHIVKRQNSLNETIKKLNKLEKAIYLNTNMLINDLLINKN